MTRVQQRAFIRELCDNVRNDLLKQSALIPENWDGYELRQWIADRFAESSWLKDKQNKRRYREYKNAILTIGRI